MKISRSEFVQFRDCRIHVRIWGEADAPKLFFLHGLADVSASFQFVVDELKRDWQVIAPDWRGFGLSQWSGDTYWYPDYLADLDALLEHYSPTAPARVVGHSLGGNVLCIYAGVRPQRVDKFVTIEGFGLLAADSASAPENYAKWLEQLRTPGGKYRDYASREELAARLIKDNPRLTAERASFLAEHMSQQREDGRYEMMFDPAHRRVNPLLYRLDEVMACWRKITAPALWILARNSFVHERFAMRQDDYATRKACFPDVREIVIEECGHNVHHDHPERLAALLDGFFS